MKAGKRFWAVFDKTIVILMAMSAALVLLDTVAVTVDVLIRYFFGKTYAGLFEITEYSLLWMTFLGTTWILRNNGHVRVDLLITLLPQKPRAVVNVVASVISVLLLVAMTYYSAKLTLHDFNTSFTLSGVLRPLKWPIEIIIPIGFLLLTIQLSRNAYELLMDLKAIRTVRDPIKADQPR
jgi:TRAP-type C4-dicarboxylate transport system permease small subunit